jgi:hypothetical protein
MGSLRLDIIYNHFETATAWIPRVLPALLGPEYLREMRAFIQENPMFHETMKLSELRATAEIRTYGRSDMNSR